MFVLKGKGTFRHLGYADRIKIEALQKTGTCVKEIAAYIGCSVSTVYRELETGELQTVNLRMGDGIRLQRGHCTAGL